ncbi:ATP-binding cassette sub-family G member 1-like isoform X2 [Phymastichus coffea]|uniref:ATP-binding cassette sub-family G member 1-like isoform X2 n=1 Tax=Phymastichus coffea TaxID=108790 RepID=UPI00273BC658|nr:ATP-binding cassette sub-family G member 1-like isoform X2 [Phymastichus coffea]
MMESEKSRANPDRLSLSFNNISYSVRSGVFSKKWKKLLSDICGDFQSGELTAIMGPSGAGKSTLMDILTGFTTSGWQGEVLVNGSKRNLASFRRSSAYIMQDDQLQPLLTVAEAMRIAADLKLESNLSSCEKKHGIDVILKEMSLESAMKTHTKDLSGGQRKRLAIALELISNPPIMFFDEPTSGLDSVTSRQCLGLLKSLAREGRTIVCSIHQPSASLFDMIDHLYVLDRGHCVYTGSARNLVSFLRNSHLQCPTYYDPADFLLEVLNGDYGEEHVERLINSSDNGKCKRWLNDSANSSSVNESSGMRCLEYLPKLPLSAMMINYESQSFRANSAYYVNGFFWQLWTLLKRNIIKLSRDRILLYVRLILHVLIGLLVGSMYYQIGQDAALVRDNVSLLFFTLIFVVFNAFNITYITCTLISEEKPINRLRPQCISLNFSCTRIADPDTLVAQIIGLIVGISFSVRNAVMFGPMAVVPFMVFSGHFVYLNDAPSYIQWLFHVSFFKYAFEGVVVAIYGYDRPKLNCSADYCHFRLPKTLLKMVDMLHSNYWISAVFMIGLYIALDVTAFLLLRVRLRRRKCMI